MIGKIIYSGGYRHYLCDGCKKVEKFQSYQKAREAGWGISRNRERCYCPDCAPFYRHVGRTGKKRSFVQLNVFQTK